MPGELIVYMHMVIKVSTGVCWYWIPFGIVEDVARVSNISWFEMHNLGLLLCSKSKETNCTGKSSCSTNKFVATRPDARVHALLNVLLNKADHACCHHDLV